MANPKATPVQAVAEMKKKLQQNQKQVKNQQKAISKLWRTLTQTYFQYLEEQCAKPKNFACTKEEFHEGLNALNSLCQFNYEINGVNLSADPVRDGERGGNPRESVNNLNNPENANGLVDSAGDRKKPDRSTEKTAENWIALFKSNASRPLEGLNDFLGGDSGSLSKKQKRMDQNTAYRILAVRSLVQAQGKRIPPA